MLCEDHAAFRSQVDLDKVSDPHLAGRYQVGDRKHDDLLDRSFQVPSSIPQVCAFLEEEILDTLSAMKKKLGCAGRKNPLLHHSQFDLYDLLQVLWS